MQQQHTVRTKFENKKIKEADKKKSEHARSHNNAGEKRKKRNPDAKGNQKCEAYPGVGVPSSRVEAVLVPLVRVP